MSKRKLLLADDSVTIQKVVNLTFADEGIEVIAVGDGDSAMDKLAEISPDLVMADVNMPGLNGYQICEQIKQDELLRETPVILLVGSFEPFDEAEAQRVGADDFLTKPFQSIRQLVNKVTVLLNSQRGGVADARHLADTLEMDHPQMERASEMDAPVQFDDSGMDDEMIQTDQVSNYSLDESAKFETREPIEDPAKTQPLTSDEMRDFDFSGTPEKSPEEEELRSSEAESETEFEDDSEIAETAETEEESVTDESEIYADSEETEAPEAYTETEETELAEATEESEVAEISETPTEESFAETEIAEVAETSEIAEESFDDAEESFAETEETEESAEETVETVEEPVEAVAGTHEDAIPMPESASILEFDEGDLLELPPIEYEDEQEAELEAETESEPEAETREKPVGLVQGETTDTVSPDLIEAIANRVMEKLSEKAVKEVAWEVVPQMTELIVKKMAEEKLKE